MIENMMKPKQHNSTQEETSSDGPTLVTRYCSRARKVFRIVQRHWSLMYSDQEDIQKYINNRPTLTYRSNPNLARMLIRVRLKRPHTTDTAKTMTTSWVTLVVTAATPQSYTHTCTGMHTHEHVHMQIHTLTRTPHHTTPVITLCIP